MKNKIWSLATNNCSLFEAENPQTNEYSESHHLAEMVDLLGPPPQSFLLRGGLASQAFAEDGQCLSITIVLIGVSNANDKS